jgi:hypothetical protein
MHRVFEVPDTQAAFVAAPEPPRELFEALGMREKRLGFGKKGPPVRRQTNALLRALEQRQAEVFF